MLKANSVQEGGDHYSIRGGKDYQHWDLVADLEMNYYVANSTKYVMRWRDKNGQQDLKKAKHYVIKMMELEEAGKISYSQSGWQVFCASIGRMFGTRVKAISLEDKKELLRSFIRKHDVNDAEAGVFWLLCIEPSKVKFELALKNLNQLLSEFDEEGGAPTPAYVNQG